MYVSNFFEKQMRWWTKVWRKRKLLINLFFLINKLLLKLRKWKQINNNKIERRIFRFFNAFGSQTIATNFLSAFNWILNSEWHFLRSSFPNSQRTRSEFLALNWSLLKRFEQEPALWIWSSKFKRLKHINI